MLGQVFVLTAERDWAQRTLSPKSDFTAPPGPVHSLVWEHYRSFRVFQTFSGDLIRQLQGISNSKSGEKECWWRPWLAPLSGKL